MSKTSRQLPGWLDEGVHPDPVEQLRVTVVESKQTAESEPSEVKLKRFNVELPVELHSAVKSKSALEGVSMRELAERIFRQYVSN